MAPCPFIEISSAIAHSIFALSTLIHTEPVNLLRPEAPRNEMD